jgi:solute carrier family 41
MILLFIAHVIIHAMWRYKIDPDSSSIPYLTALGDLLGSSLLLLAFMFLRSIGREYEQKTIATEIPALLATTLESFTTSATF